MTLAEEAFLCGDRKGRLVIKGKSVSSSPAAEYTRVVSKISERFISGKIPGSLLASMVLPLPGGPIRIMLYMVLSFLDKADEEA